MNIEIFKYILILGLFENQFIFKQPQYLVNIVIIVPWKLILGVKLRSYFK